MGICLNTAYSKNYFSFHFFRGKHYLNFPFNIASNIFCRCQVLSPLTITLERNMQSRKHCKFEKNLSFQIHYRLQGVRNK